MSTDINKYYNNFDTERPDPSALAYEIDEHVDGECSNLKNDTGTTGMQVPIGEGGDGNCPELNNDLLAAIKQEFNYIKNGGNFTIFANEDSKCSPGDGVPTVASILSRILRFAEAANCILCTFDPFLVTLLKSGSYPQILMGGTGTPGSMDNYPRWVTPSDHVTMNSELPVTSAGVYKAIQDAINTVFHEATDDIQWLDGGGLFYYKRYAEDASTLISQDTTGLAHGDCALVHHGEDGLNQLYVWTTSNSWQAATTFVNIEPNNYAIIAIEGGSYANSELYWLRDVQGNTSWNVMDATLDSLKDLEERLARLESIAVKPYDNTSQYYFHVTDTWDEAQAIPGVTGKTTITLVIGE